MPPLVLLDPESASELELTSWSLMIGSDKLELLMAFDCFEGELGGSVRITRGLLSFAVLLGESTGAGLGFFLFFGLMDSLGFSTFGEALKKFKVAESGRERKKSHVDVKT